jgi:hypothetical protein
MLKLLNMSIPLIQQKCSCQCFQDEHFELCQCAECSDYWNHSGVHTLNHYMAKTPDTPCDIDLWRDAKVIWSREVRSSLAFRH